MYKLTVYLQSSDGEQLDVTPVNQTFSDVRTAVAFAKTLKLMPPPTHYRVTNKAGHVVGEGLI